MLGLAVCREFVLQPGGQIEVEGRPRRDLPGGPPSGPLTVEPLPFRWSDC